MSKQKEFIELYKRHHDQFCRFCSARSYGIMPAEDLISESYLRAYSGFDRLRSKQAFKSYLYTIASNVIKNALRDRKEMLDIDQASVQTAEGINPYQFDVESLYKAISQLPEKTAESLLLFEISGFSIKEIAEQQNSGESAVKARLRRGREKLGELLGAPVEALKKSKGISVSKMMTLL